MARARTATGPQWEGRMTSSWVCDACYSLNDGRATSCYKCRVKRGMAADAAG